MKRPKTRLEEIRTARGLTKAELARKAKMPPQTLQRIEDGSTKGLTPAARGKLAPVLGVRDDQLLMPIGFPIDPLPGEAASTDDMLLAVCMEILDEVKVTNTLLRVLADRLDRS